MLELHHFQFRFQESYQLFRDTLDKGGSNGGLGKDFCEILVQ